MDTEPPRINSQSCHLPLTWWFVFQYFSAEASDCNKIKGALNIVKSNYNSLHLVASIITSLYMTRWYVTDLMCYIRKMVGQHYCGRETFLWLVVTWVLQSNLHASVFLWKTTHLLCSSGGLCTIWGGSTMPWPMVM